MVRLIDEAHKRGATTDRIVMGPVSAVVYRLSRP